jgi:hypothetical protein
VTANHAEGLRKTISKMLFKHGKNDGISVYVPKESILKEIAAKWSMLREHFFFLPSLGTF